MSNPEAHDRPFSSVAALAAVVCLIVGAVAGCGRSEEESEQARAQSKIERIRESHERIGRRPSIAATNAEPARLMPGIGRPCDVAKDFDHYFLGSSFESLPLNHKGWQCTPPPRKVRAASGTIVFFSPGRVNAYSYTYGGCSPRDPHSGRDESRCPPALSISSSPTCERPHSIVRRYGGGTPLTHTHTRVRGVPAALYSEPGRVPTRKMEIFTGDAVVVIYSKDGDLVRRAAAKIVAAPTSIHGSRTPRGRLPAPVKGAAQDDARRNPPC